MSGTIRILSSDHDTLIWDVAGWVFDLAVDYMIVELEAGNSRLASFLSAGRAASQGFDYVDLEELSSDDYGTVVEAAQRARPRIVEWIGKAENPADAEIRLAREAQLARFDELLNLLKKGFQRRSGKTSG